MCTVILLFRYGAQPYFEGGGGFQELDIMVISNSILFRVRVWPLMGFGLLIGFIEHLYT
jgi:hypothetical protein